MLAKLPHIDWSAVVGALGLAGALIGWFFNRRDNKKTSARQDDVERRERERERRAVAEHVWVTVSGPFGAISKLGFLVFIYNRSHRPIYDCRLEKLSKLSDAIQFSDELNPLSQVLDDIGRPLNLSDLTVPIVLPVMGPENKSGGKLDFQVPGTFDPKRAGLKSAQTDNVFHASVELSFSDGANRWLAYSKGTPPKLLRLGD
jgi:hypothetical protein